MNGGWMDKDEDDTREVKTPIWRGCTLPRSARLAPFLTSLRTWRKGSRMGRSWTMTDLGTVHYPVGSLPLGDWGMKVGARGPTVNTQTHTLTQSQSTLTRTTRMGRTRRRMNI